jgi:hypothetical protein
MNQNESYYHIKNIVEAWQLRDKDLLCRKIKASHAIELNQDNLECKKVNKKIEGNADYYLNQIQILFHHNDVKKLRELLKILSDAINFTFRQKGRNISNGKKQAKQRRQML